MSETNRSETNRIPGAAFARLAPEQAPWADPTDVMYGDYYAGMGRVVAGLSATDYVNPNVANPTPTAGQTAVTKRS